MAGNANKIKTQMGTSGPFVIWHEDDMEKCAAGYNIGATIRTFAEKVKDNEQYIADLDAWKKQYGL